jgi:hypothetical protein
MDPLLTLLHSDNLKNAKKLGLGYLCGLHNCLFGLKEFNFKIETLPRKIQMLAASVVKAKGGDLDVYGVVIKDSNRYYVDCKDGSINYFEVDGVGRYYRGGDLYCAHGYALTTECGKHRVKRSIPHTCGHSAYMRLSPWELINIVSSYPDAAKVIIKKALREIEDQKSALLDIKRAFRDKTIKLIETDRSLDAAEKLKQFYAEERKTLKSELDRANRLNSNQADELRAVQMELEAAKESLAKKQAVIDRLDSEFVRLSDCTKSHVAYLQEATREIRELKKEVDGFHRSNECPLCSKIRNKTAFMCGHWTCSDCSKHLEHCPKCQTKITATIQLH